MRQSNSNITKEAKTLSDTTNEWFVIIWKSVCDSYHYYIPSVICFLGLMLTEKHITKWLTDLQKDWVEDLNQHWFAVITVMSVLLYVSVVLWKIIQKRFYISHKTVNWWAGSCIIYSYYRFFNSAFVFWGIEISATHIAYLDILYMPLILLVVYKIFYRYSSDNHDKGSRVLNDEAITKPHEDIFGYVTIAKHLLEDLKSIDVSDHSFSVGIAGMWGTGKSSFLNLLEDEIKRTGNIVVRFYPRSSSRVELIQDDFLCTFSDVLGEYHTGFGKIISRYVKALKLFEGEGLLNNLTNGFESLNSEDEKRQINEALKKINKKVFVVVEDLDRLTGEELLEVFKVIDRNGDFSSVYYLSAYDKVYVNEVLHAVLGHNIKQDYTDKYFSYELPLPPQKMWMIQRYIRSYLQTNAQYSKTILNTTNIVEEWDKVGSRIVNALGTVRHVKRFINLFMSRYPHVHQDVNVSDFLLLTLIRYKNYSLYEAIIRLEIVTKGGWLNGSTTTMYLVKNYQQKLEKMQVDGELKDVLEILFPIQKEHDYGEGVFKRLRRVDSFDLYFYERYSDKVYYKDLSPMFEEKSDDKALECLRKLLENQNNWASVEEYLRYHELTWINTTDILRRYIKLIVYSYHLQKRNLNYYCSFAQLLRKNVAEQLIGANAAKDLTEYKDIVKSALLDMVKYCDASIGLFINSLLDEFLEHADLADEFIFSSKPTNEYVEISVECLKSYMGRLNENWNPELALALAMIHPVQGDKIETTAQELIWGHISSNPEMYYKNMVSYVIQVYEDPEEVQISFNELFKWQKAFGDWDKNFPYWVEKISDNSAKDLLTQLFDANKKGNNYLTGISLQDKYERDDFKGFLSAIAEKIRIEVEEKQKQLIIDFLASNGPSFKQDIVNGTRLKPKEVSNLIVTLLKENTVIRDKKKYLINKQ